jgi:hypothetical protein
VGGKASSNAVGYISRIFGSAPALNFLSAKYRASNSWSIRDGRAIHRPFDFRGSAYLVAFLTAIFFDEDMPISSGRAVLTLLSNTGSFDRNGDAVVIESVEGERTRVVVTLSAVSWGMKNLVLLVIVPPR